MANDLSLTSRMMAWTSTLPAIQLATSACLGWLALSPSPSFIPMVLLIANLRVQAAGSSAGPPGTYLGPRLFQWFLTPLAISLTSSVPHWDTPLSVVVAFLLYLIQSYFAVSVLQIERTLSDTPSLGGTVQPVASILILPIIWPTACFALSIVNPIGRLMTWTPLIGSGRAAYNWVQPIAGQPAVDCVVAGWVLVVSEAFLIWRATNDVPLIDLGEPTMSRSDKESSFRCRRLFLFLVVLTIPSYFGDSSPPPPHSSDTIAVNLACILPVRKAGMRASFDEFLTESMALGGRADIMLWPENAVRFQSIAQKEEAFGTVRAKLRNATLHKWIGVSFLEPVSLKDGTHSGPDRTRSGMALISADKIAFQYFKRHLVPVTESYKRLASKDTPSIVNLPLGGRRSVSVAPAICLDNAFPLSLVPSTEAPDLILSPASTWHEAIGQAMVETARARADEIQTRTLWCDGSPVGLSGIIGGPTTEFIQMGPGTFVKTIGINHGGRSATLRQRFGEVGGVCLILVFAMSLLAASTLSRCKQLGRLHETSRRLVRLVTDWWREVTSQWAVRRRGANGDRSPAIASPNDRLVDDS